MASRTSKSDASVAEDAGAQRPCPICGTLIDPASASARTYRPFCSRACADIDLLRWLRGAYAIPSTGADEDEDGEASQEPMAARDPSAPGGRGNGGETH